MKLINIIIAVLVFSFLSCDPPVFQVPLDGTYKKEIGFECGTIEIECNTIGGINFTIKQVYHITNAVKISPQSFSIKHKEKVIKYTTYLNGKVVNEMQNIKNEDIVIVDFIEKISKNESITINLDNFLYCNDNSVNFGNIHLVIK